MAINPELLLFIEPKNEPSKEPIIDELTRKMTASLRKAEEGGIYDYEKIGSEYVFDKKGGWFGFHDCSCGARGGGRDFLLSNGEMTNEHCIHYIAYHRDEISKEQLIRVLSLNDGEETPTKEELKIPKKIKHNGSMTRQKYLNMENKKWKK